MKRLNPCPVPGCSHNISLTSPFGVCYHHTDMFNAITYYLKKAQEQATAAAKKGGRPGERVSPSGLILP